MAWLRGYEMQASVQLVITISQSDQMRSRAYEVMGECMGRIKAQYQSAKLPFVCRLCYSRGKTSGYLFKQARRSNDTPDNRYPIFGKIVE
jgi:hypothetical protein